MDNKEKKNGSFNSKWICTACKKKFFPYTTDELIKWVINKDNEECEKCGEIGKIFSVEGLAKATPKEYQRTTLELQINHNF